MAQEGTVSGDGARPCSESTLRVTDSSDASARETSVFREGELVGAAARDAIRMLTQLTSERLYGLQFPDLVNAEREDFVTYREGAIFVQ